MEKKQDNNFLHKLATVIVDKRYLFFLLYTFAIIFCLFSSNWVIVENDVTTYLPEETETRQGLDVMNNNFTTFASAQIMVSNITYEEALDIEEKIENVDGVQMVSFDDSENHYHNASALYDVNFKGLVEDEISIKAMESIYDELDGYDLTIDTPIGYDETKALNDDMTVILIVAVIIIIVVLNLTSRAYAEVPVLLLTFGAAAVLNKGTNFLCGKISFISNSIAVVLQLALAIDYAIILCHRFSDEHETKDSRTACIDALTKAIPEISASSLTTISGLIALSFMQFAIGLDMSIVLIKSVLLSLLSVFTLMPGLLVLFSPLIDKTKHKKILPNITFLGNFANKSKKIIPAFFLVILIVACVVSSHCPYCYSYSDIKTTKMSERQMAHFKIQDTFGNNNLIALIVPSGDYESEQKIAKHLESVPEVKNVLSLSTIEVKDDYALSDAVTPREFSELIGIDFELSKALYSAYAFEQDQYGELLQGLNEYNVPLFDMFTFLKDQTESHNINLSDDFKEDIDDLFEQLDLATVQLQSKDYSRIVMMLNTPEESDQTFKFLDDTREYVSKYYQDDFYLVGNSTSSCDLASSFSNDNLLISILSALFVILVLLFTFQSIGLPILLIVVIQGSIWLNFSVPAIVNQPLYFLGYLIVNSIQMGANIDYAIVISSHYQEYKETMPHNEAIVCALNSAFPTIFTSGSIMASAGLLIGFLSANPVISIMGTCLGRGTIISIILVLCVLPAILVFGDSIIEKTKFKLKVKEKNTMKDNGNLKIKGHVKGRINGTIDADVDGLIVGDLDVTFQNSKEANN